MNRFRDMYRLLNIPHVGGDFFTLGMVTNVGQYISDANEVLSLVLKITSLISFGIFILLNTPRIKVRIAQIRRKRINRKRKKKP